MADDTMIKNHGIIPVKRLFRFNLNVLFFRRITVGKMDSDTVSALRIGVMRKEVVRIGNL